MPAEQFADLEAFVDLPRLDGLRLSPDGSRLVVAVGTPDRAANRFRTALWELDPAGVRPARRLTRSGHGESGAAFTPDGDLLFVSARPDAADETGTALWRQPRDGGDPRLLVRPPGGVRGLVVGASGTAVFGTQVLPSAKNPLADGGSRAETGASGILHESYPVRYWDHDVGPERTRLVTADLAADPLVPDDLTGHVGGALAEPVDWDLTPDGSTVVTAWLVAEPRGDRRSSVVAIDLATGARRTLADDDTGAHEYESPCVSPDGSRVALVVHTRTTPEHPGDWQLAVLDLAGGAPRPVAPGWDRWPGAPRWTADGAALLVTASDGGRCPVWRVDLATDEVTRLTPDDGAYTGLQVAPDGRWLYALRSTVAQPPAPVRIAVTGTPQVQPLPGPAPAPELPGRLTEVSTTAADGTVVRGWLSVPHGASAQTPAPLLVQVHGGPLMSANAWKWRWNPWLAVARGYAVLQPDYALSSGYGMAFVRRGWGRFGDAPYTDLLAMTDAAQALPEVDGGRAAVAGASFGGYLTNWIAGHTDRYAAIISHASVWDFDLGTDSADVANLLRRQRPPGTAARYSPHLFAEHVVTPVLVVHGGRDYRVPVGQALHLWRDLVSRSAAARASADGSVPHRFLYFPDEGHFIQRPANVVLVHTVYLDFLDHHVRGLPWQPPDVLG